MGEQAPGNEGYDHDVMREADSLHYNYDKSYNKRAEDEIRGKLADSVFFAHRQALEEDGKRRGIKVSSDEQNIINAIGGEYAEATNRALDEVTATEEATINSVNGEKAALWDAREHYLANKDQYIENARQLADEALAPRGEKINLVPTPGKQPVSVGSERVTSPQ